MKNIGLLPYDSDNEFPSWIWSLFLTENHFYQCFQAIPKTILALDHCHGPRTWIPHSYITVQNLSHFKGEFFTIKSGSQSYFYRRINSVSAVLRVLKSKLMEKCNSDEPATSSGMREAELAFLFLQQPTEPIPTECSTQVFFWFKYLHK